jgi:3-polyprenyl-4-hydroxybenzoate decarboxylase
MMVVLGVFLSQMWGLGVFGAAGVIYGISLLYNLAKHAGSAS